jgi:Cd2+/Zn2+-exporting ATPase
MVEQGLALPDHAAEEQAGMSVVYVASGDTVLGWIGFKDKLRRESMDMVKSLRANGVRYVSMVTGDRASVAETVAETLQLDDFRSECLPEGKVEFVENLKRSNRVAVVGDGVNDAPALAAATD